MRWNGSNRKHYEKLGYKYTGHNTEFTVRVSDLSPVSHSKIKAKCDICGNEKTINFDEYQRNTHGNSGLYHCFTCASLKRFEKLRNDFAIVRKLFKDKGYTLISDSGEYHNVRSKLKYICLKHKDRGAQKTTYDCLTKSVNVCKWCKKEVMSINASGKNNGHWRGGITPLNLYLRGLTREWKIKQLQRAHYKCELTGNGGELEVHHRFSFGKIVEIILDELQINIRPINEYSMEEMEDIAEIFLDKHEELSQPIVLSVDIHHLYHSIYGKYNNTPEQFEEFHQRWLAGEFDG